MESKTFFKSVLNDFLQLIYPRYCLLCECTLLRAEKTLCLSCQYKLPRFSNKFNSSQLLKIFWGRTHVHNAFTYLHFEKGNSVQKLIFQLKYKGEKAIGELVGNWLGNEMLALTDCSQFDCIVPVPIHYKKRRIRGYNQSEIFGTGLSEALNITIENNSLFRLHHGSSQTKKSRFERWKNVTNEFSLKNDKLLSNKHILVVDDVLTTGSTLEAVANKLLTLPGTKVSVATMAFSNLT